MSLSSMRLAMAEAVAADGDLRSWCVLTYGREHSVYLDVDLRDPPGEDACPYVVISSIGQSAAQDRPFKEYFFGVLCIVHEDSDVISIHDNLYMHAGGENAEVFRKLVETAAAGVLVNETLRGGCGRRRGGGVPIHPVGNAAQNHIAGPHRRGPA